TNGGTTQLMGEGGTNTFQVAGGNILGNVFINEANTTVDANATLRDILLFDAAGGTSDPTSPTKPQGQGRPLINGPANPSVFYDDINAVKVITPPTPIAADQTISEGDDLTLDGTASYAGAGYQIVSYAWDLDGSGQYASASGVAPTIPWSSLQQ